MKEVNKNIIFICYEYDGYNSTQTTALVKRPRYLADYFVAKGYHVTVFFSYKEDFVKEEIRGKGKLTLISCSYEFVPIITPSWLQKIRTAVLTLYMGDFSSLWNKKVYKLIAQHEIEFKNLIAFFTPRGPLYTAYKLKEKQDFNLIYDFQDPLDEGFENSPVKNLLHRFYKKIFSRADYVTCVSKYWTQQLKELYRDAQYIPHAIENANPLPISQNNGILKILYYGSINFEIQSLNTFKSFITSVKKSLPQLQVEFDFAGNDFTYKELKERLKGIIDVNYLGWLSKEEVVMAILDSDILFLLPWTDSIRKGVPSKFYEYCKFNRPIFILGKDSGGFQKEFGSDFHTSYILHKWEETGFKNKEEILKSGFLPNTEFLDKLLVTTVGEKFEKLLIK